MGSRRGQRTATSRSRAGKTAVSDDPLQRRARDDGRAPDVFRAGRLDSDARISRGRGGRFRRSSAPAPAAERSPASSPKHGFSVVALDAGPYFRPLEDFASDESEQTKLYWTDDRIVDGDNPLQMGSNNSGKAVGGSTVHFAMVSLRFRPEWFKSRTVLGYGADWPLDWREMWRLLRRGRAGAENRRPRQLSLGPASPALSLSRARAERGGRALARGCEAMGINGRETPLATLVGAARPALTLVSIAASV